MNQLDNEYQESGIRSEFLSIANYKATMEFAQKRNDNYLKFCTLIQGYYADFKAMSKHISDRIKLNQGDGLSSIKQFKQFLIDFIKIIEEVAVFKTEYYEQLREIEVDPIRSPTLEMISRMGKYNDLQIKYQQVYKNINATNTNITSSYNQLKKEVKDPLVFFDQKYVKTKSTNLQGLIKSKQEFQVQGNGLLDSIYKNTVQFEKEIGFYRQKMLSGKYKVHKKLSEMSKGARQCLTQTLLALTQQIGLKYKKFQQTLKEQIKESTLLSKFKKRINSKADESNDKLSQIIITATQQYNELINEVENIIKTLMEGFSLISVNCKEYSQTSKLIVQQINKLYENDQSPTPQMIQSLELFHFFCQKIGQIPNLLHIHQANVVKLRQNINKHSEITMTLLKCTVHKGKMDPSGAPNKNIEQLNHLFDQLSYDYVNEFIDKIYKLMEDSLGYLKNYFNMKYHKKKKNNVEDSMDISHIEEQYNRPHKKPSKKEMWLWKEFKNVQKYKRLQSQAQADKQILKFISVFNQIKIESQKEVDKFNCSISGKKQIKGVLKILAKNIIFTSSNIDLNIPLEFVEEVTVNVKIFEKQLTIKTSVGEIAFNHFPEFSKAEVLLNQQMTHAQSSKKTTKKASVELTSEQLQFINTRKVKIQTELESLDGFVEQTSIVLENIGIDAVYDLIYSDKPFKFKGKEQCCFMSYALKKSGGSKYTTTKYTPPGPKFYSLEDGKTFINTPLFSERTSEYEVPLPPIPFMPKFCTNKESVRIFWISNTQFDYFIKSQSRGAPYADSFFLNIFHKVVKIEKDVQIKIYFKITFIKDTSMRSMISSKSAEQAKSKSTALLQEAAKIIKMGGTGGTETGGGNAQSAQEQKTQEKEEGSKIMGSQKVKKLENQNKILIGVLVAVILINLLLRLF